MARRATSSLGALRSDGAARWVFIWPTVLIILVTSLFPLVASLVLSVSRLVLAPGGFKVNFVGFLNFNQLLFGSERVHFLGLLKQPTLVGWAAIALSAVLAIRWFVRAARSGEYGPFGLVLRLMIGLAFVGFVWYAAQALLSDGGRPGSLLVTMIFVTAGITLQYLLGLGLALLAVQQLPLRRYFRVIFLIPLTITPVGIGYMFLMMTDTNKGPFAPLWAAVGLRNYSWVNDPWAARVAVLIGDTWQWTPFVFIVLLAALESVDQETLEAAFVDGAGRWQSFRQIVFPAILPVSTTIVLIRLIEGFKMIDMPKILLGGGPGTATQTMSLESYLDWNTLNLGRSAAVAYLLLFVVTIAATVFVSLTRPRPAPAGGSS
jgi:multiple sugar transport system permease protein